MSPEDRAELADRAEWHGVDGPVWLSMRSQVGGVSSPALERLASRYRFALASHLHALHELNLVSEALATIPHFVVKGPVLAVDWYSRPDLRSYGDVDVVVLPEMFAFAVEALEKIGGVVLDRNWSLLTEVMAGQLHVQLPGGRLVDLHWSLHNHRQMRAEFPLPTFELFDRSVVSSLGVMTLNPVDTLVHLGLHGALAGADRLLWLKDVEQVLRRGDMPWPSVIERAKAARLGIPLALVLARSRRTLSAAVPNLVIDSLAPWRLARRLGAWLDRVSPVETTDPDGSVCRLVARSCRATPAASVGEFGRRAASWTLHRRHPNLWNPQDPRSVTYEGGGSVAREAYLRAVTAFGLAREVSR